MTSTSAGSLPPLAAVAKMIDHSLLRPELTAADVSAGLETAVGYATASVCVRPADVPAAVAALAGTAVRVGTVVGFPHGSSTIRSKVDETRELVALGAEEIDMVINIGRLRSGEMTYVGEEIAGVVGAADARVVKVIFENAYLDEAQKVAGYRAAAAGGAAFVKTSSGFAPGGATADDIALMRRTVPPHVGVKAAGGVRTLDALLQLHELGATRFGATATAAILDDLARRLHGEAPPPAPAADRASTAY
jgi:deoxyribose-phosphate aldolase